jgi:hypothetical protein
VVGKVTQANTKTVTLSTSDSGDIEINSVDKPLIYYQDTQNNMKKTNFTFFDEDDQVVALGTTKEEDFVARTVYDLTLTSPTPKP